MWRPAILQKAEAALLDEKAAKLRGLAQVLDDQLGESFDAHIRRVGLSPDAPDEVRFEALVAELRPLTDRLAAAFQGVGLGYFDARLNRIVAYAPSSQLGYLVGVVPPPDHLGRLAMERRAVRIAIGSMVRGDAMNCMHPLIREGRVIGFSFANESVEDIYRQIQSGAGRTGQAADLPTAFGLSGLAVFAGASSLSARAIREQLQQAAARGAVEQSAVLPLMQGLQQVERYVRLFLDNLGTGVVVVDGDGLVQFCNEAAGRLFGQSAESILLSPWPKVVEAIGLELERPEPDPLSVEQQLVAGQIRRGESSTAVDLMVSALPGLPGHRLFLFDEADRARREGGYFERAERLALAGELATSIAHEIRNPLTVVAGSIQLIPDRVGDAEFLNALSRIAGKELARVNRIIQGLLGFARYSEPERSLLDLNDLIRQAVEFLDWYAKKRDVTVVLDLAPGSPKVFGDGEHLKQALLNLMMNGIQAMEAGGGDLTIRTDQPPGSRSVRISITDEGVGIPPEALAKIWEVFYSTKSGGTGLGLPVVQRIIDAHRGYIEVDSTPGEGTCFTVLLPVANRPHLSGEEGSHAHSTASGGR
ncbi:MAG: ATP-binding protein [Bacillota bacterium]